MTTTIDELPIVSHVDAGSAAARCGLMPGDAVVRVNGVVPRDVLEWARLVDDDTVEIIVMRGREEVEITVRRGAGEPFGAGVSSAVFDRVQTCDNHCEFCFIYQLPKGMRRSLYLKDDDYRLSFLFGNFTTLTRFTEADLERVVTERLSPLHVSVHAASPSVRAQMLRNDRGGFSLRWAKALLAEGIAVKAQIVLCPGVNDGDVFDDTMARLLEECPTLVSVAVVPLGLSRHNTENRMRVHTPEEARAAIDRVEHWASLWRETTGARVVHAADELYLLAARPLPPTEEYGEFPMLEDGIGLARSFLDDFSAVRESPSNTVRDAGFFGSVDGPGYVRSPNPAVETSLRRSVGPVPVSIGARARRSGPVAVLTGECAAPVVRQALDSIGRDDVAVHAVANGHFGGNTSVAGLMTGGDVRRVLESLPSGVTYLLPDVCLNDGRFLDDVLVDDLSRTHTVEVLPSTGGALRRRVDASPATQAAVVGERE